LGEEKLRENETNIYNQLKEFLENLKLNHGINFDYEMVNNYDFYKDMNYLKFLTDVGTYITVNQMSAKESVKKRLIDPDKSISYTEFSYMLIQ
jgi:tyrosyl-tRNA synthetase